MPRLLELFSGTGSFGKVFREAGWEVLSIDLCADFAPDLCEDVLEIPLDRWPEGYFSHVHASPPCTCFSRCRTNAKEPPDMLTARRMVLHSLCLIRAIKPKTWTLENPATGTLKSESFMLPHKFKDLSYCKYSIPGGAEEYAYRKASRFWHGGFDWSPKVCKYDCLATVCGKRHLTTAQRGTCSRCPTDRSYTQAQLYRIPRLLVMEILAAITS